VLKRNSFVSSNRRSRRKSESNYHLSTISFARKSNIHARSRGMAKRSQREVNQLRKRTHGNPGILAG